MLGQDIPIASAESSSTIRRVSDQQKSAAKIKTQHLLHDIEFPPTHDTQLLFTRRYPSPITKAPKYEVSHHAESPNFIPFMHTLYTDAKTDANLASVKFCHQLKSLKYHLKSCHRLHSLDKMPREVLLYNS